MTASTALRNITAGPQQQVVHAGVRVRKPVEQHTASATTAVLYLDCRQATAATECALQHEP
jgi:hypothetical protein